MPRHTPSLSSSAGAGGAQKLPPLSLMQTPGAELSAFGWGVDSLRTGPLSPALLNGPAGTSIDFDPSTYRTGLTPLVAGAGGPPGVSGSTNFPPPSPATAALFAMMTNNTPGTADAQAAAMAAGSGLTGGGPRPHEGPNEGNQFDASFGRANSDVGPILHHQPHVQGQPAPLTNLHRSALANQVNGVAPGGGPPRSLSLNTLPSHPPPPNAFYPPPPQQNGGYFAANAPQQSSHPLAAPPVVPYSTAPPPAQNSLDLLTQASYQTDDALVAAAALSGLATPGGGFPAAAVLAAANAAASLSPPQGNGVMPGSTVGGGPGAAGTNGNGNGAHRVSPSPSAGSSTTGRGKRTLSATTSQPALTTGKRARKATAAAQELEAQNAYEAEQAAGKKGAAGKRGKRGASATAAAAAKKQKEEDEMMMMDDDDEDDMKMTEGYQQAAPSTSGTGKGRGRKKDTGETEEEKRKNFLERNRQGKSSTFPSLFLFFLILTVSSLFFITAALKCRQRKKQWLQSLQTKVELLTTDNDQLQSTVNNLKEEVHSLRAILAAHSNCPVVMSNAPPPPPGHIQQQQQQQHPPHPQHPQHAHEMQMMAQQQHQGRRQSLPGPPMQAIPINGPPPGYPQAQRY